MRNDANSLGSIIDLQWSETFNRKVVKKSFEMFNYRVADDRSDCLCGKVFETRFDSEGSTSRLVPSAVQTFRIMSWKYSLRSLHENSPYRCLNFRRLAPLFPYLMVISTITFEFANVLLGEEENTTTGDDLFAFSIETCRRRGIVYKIDLIVSFSRKYCSNTWFE